MNLNLSQLRAVKSTARTIAVVANPGAGKTRTLCARIEAGDPFASRVILTFTNAAAHELRKRLTGVNVNYCGTLHGYCFRLLQRHGSLIGYRAGGVNLLSEADAEALLLACAKDLGWKGSRKALDFTANHAVALIRKEYQHRLKRNNLVDYDAVLEAGLMIICLRGVERVDELYIDEAQDSAVIDWQIYNAFPAETKFIVGDPDQSIYGFRGAYPKGFVNFATAADLDDGSELITLEANYRSGTRICAAATSLIGHNKLRVPKAVVAATDAESSITVTCYPDHLAEINGVVQMVRESIPPPTEPDPEIAVLCRTNELRENFAQALTAAGIPVAQSRRPSLPPDWQAGLDVLNLFLDPRNDLIAEKVIKRIAPNQVARCKDAALLEGNWLSAEAAKLKVLPNEATHGMKLLCATLAPWGIGAEMRQLVAERIALLPQPQPTLADLLHDLFKNDQWAGEDATEGVAVLTVHGSKGREFDVVFLPAFEEGIMPSLKKDEDEEESRRLAFVAITRARHELHISNVAKRTTKWREVLAPLPSRFIGEMGLA